jgi:hypothetical protein
LKKVPSNLEEAIKIISISDTTTTDNTRATIGLIRVFTPYHPESPSFKTGDEGNFKLVKEKPIL